MRQRVCLAIATFNRSPELFNLLRWLRTLNDQPDEVVVVDQTPRHPSHIETYLLEGSARGEFRWIRLDRPNLPTARNVAALNCSSDIMVFVDDDTILPDGFISQYRRAFTESNVDAIAGGVIGPAGFRPAAFEVKHYRQTLQTFMPQFKAWTCDFVGSVCGCNMAVRKSVMERMGGFDRNYLGTAMYEDKDFMRRVMEAGYRCEYRSDIVLVHYLAETGGCRNSLAPWFSEFEKAGPHWRYALKFFSIGHFLRTVKVVFRSICFRKENVLKQPLLIPASLWSAFLALGQAYRTLNAR